MSLSPTSLNFSAGENTVDVLSISLNQDSNIEINKPVLTHGLVSTGLSVGSPSMQPPSFGQISLRGATSGVLTLKAAPATSDYTLSLPSEQGAEDSYLSNDGTGSLTWAVVQGGPKGFFFWDQSQGDPISNQTVNATLHGFRTGLNNGLRLGDANNVGVFNWNVSGFDFTRDFSLRLQYLGPDKISFGFGGSSPFLTGHLTVNNGIAFRYAWDVTRACRIWRNGSAITHIKDVKWAFNDVNSVEIQVRTIGSRRLCIVYGGETKGIEHSTDITDWTPAGTHIFVSGFYNVVYSLNLCYL